MPSTQLSDHGAGMKVYLCAGCHTILGNVPCAVDVDVEVPDEHCHRCNPPEED